MRSDVKYIAKQILTLSGTNEVIAFSCLTKSESKEKNADFQQVAEALKSADKKFMVVNYDEAYQGAVDVDATKICDDFSYNFQKVELPENAVALVNLKNVFGNESLFDCDGKINKLVLSTKYGKTSFNSLEKGVEVFKQNKIEVIGIIANKR